MVSPGVSTISRMTELPSAPLFVTGDEMLRAELLRLSAAAGVAPVVVRDGAAALAPWTRAALVVIGADLAGSVAALAPARRAGVHVVGHGRLPDEVFRAALGCGAETVAELPASESWLVELLTDAQDGAGTPAVTIGVLGGSGGAGATVFAAALAAVASGRGPTLAVDVDLQGPGLDRVLGTEDLPGVRWDALVQATGRLSARSLRESLPTRRDLAVLGWPPERPRQVPVFAVREVLSAARRGFRTVVLDVPRHADPVADEVLARCDHVVVVSTLTVPGVASATRTAARVPAGVPHSLVTRGRGAGISPEEVARLLRIPLLAAMRDQRGLDEAIDLGVGPDRTGRGVLTRTAREVLDALVLDPAERAA